MIEKEKWCSAQVSDGGRFTFCRCSRRGTVTRDGRDYCGQHDPVAVTAKEAARQKKLDHEAAIENLKDELGSAAAEIVRRVVTEASASHVARARQRYIDLQAQLKAMQEREP